MFGMIAANAAWRGVNSSRCDAAMTEFASLFSTLEDPRARAMQDGGDADCRAGRATRRIPARRR